MPRVRIEGLFARIDRPVDQINSNRSMLSIVVLLGSLSAFDPISIDMYLPSFPKIGQDLHAGPSMVELSLTSFFIGLAVGQLIYGPLSDHFGRKKPLLVGMTVYFFACFGCALVHDIRALIFFRVLQALGGCAGMVITRAIVRDLFEKQRAAHIFSVMILVSGMAPILAPIAGGYLAEYFGWRSIFHVLGGFCFLALVSTVLFLPETHRRSKKDVSFGAIGNTYRELFHDRHFLGYALAGGCIYAGMFAYIAGSPFVLITLFGVAPQHYGWIFGTNAMGIVCFAQLNRLLLRRFDSESILRIMVRCSALVAIALFVAALTIARRELFIFLLPLFFFVAVNGLIFPNSSATALAHQGHRAGAASSLLGTLQWSIACLSSFLVSFLHNGTAVPMVGVMLGAGVAGALTLQIASTRASKLKSSVAGAQISLDAD